MRLSQEAIRRMISGRVGSGGGGGGSFDPAALAGLASQAWVEEGYISKAFWNELFIIHKKVTTVVMNGETEVSRTVTTNTVFEPNEVPSETSTTDPETGYVTTVTTEVDNIEAKKGFWTNYFLSALGLNASGGGGGGGSSTLAGLLDVDITNPSNGQALIFNTSLNRWVNSTLGTLTLKNGQTTLGTYSPTASSTIDLALTGYLTQSAADLRYLQLTGGTLTGNVMHKSGTLERGVAPDARTVMYRSWSDKNNTYLGWFEFVGETDGDNSIGLYVLSNTTSSTNTYGGLRIVKSLGVSDSYVAELNANTGNFAAKTLQSTVATGTSPLIVASTTLVSNLNADLLDGQHGSYYGKASDVTTLQGYFTNGVANNAARLSGNGSYTAWGRTYWQNGIPQNVSGNIDFSNGNFLILKDGTNDYNLFGVSASDDTLLIGWGLKDVSTSSTTIAAGVDLNIGYGTDVNDTTYQKYWAVFHNNGHFTLNAVDSSNVLLNVGGATKTNRLYLYKPNSSNDTGAVYLEYESANSGIHLVGGGFYSDTYVSALGLNSSGGGGGSSTLADLYDVQLTAPITNGQALIYNSSLNRWVNGAAGIDMTALTTYLSTKILTLKNGNTILGTYNPTSASIIDLSSSLTGYLTQATADLRYLQLTGGTMTGNVSHKSSTLERGIAPDSRTVMYRAWRDKNDNPLGWFEFVSETNGDNLIGLYVLSNITSVSNYYGGLAIVKSIGVTDTYVTTINANTGNLSTRTLQSTVSTGTAPLTVSSTTLVSNLNADYLDGFHSYDFLRIFAMASGDDYDTLSGYTVMRGSFVAVNENSVSASNLTLSGLTNIYATLVSLGRGNRTIQLMGFGWSDDLKYRHVYTQPGTSSTFVLSPWKTIAFTDGNIATATRLADSTTRTAWGQTYWSSGQPQTISGNLSNVGNITSSASNTYNVGNRSNYFNGVYTGYLDVIDATSNNDFNIAWRTQDNKRIVAMYSYEEGIGASDIILGTTETLYGLYYNCSTGRWGVGTTSPDYKLDVNGPIRGISLYTNATTGETAILNTSASYDCIMYQLSGTSKWSVGCDASNFYWYESNSRSIVMNLTSGGNLGIGTTAPAYKLDVSGAARVSELWIGGVRIIHDTTNGGLRVVSAGLSADTYLSALGIGSEGGGGADLGTVWASMAENDSSNWIHISHIQSALSTYLSQNHYITSASISDMATKTWIGQQGYLTSDSLSGYATQTWVNNQGFVKSSGVTSVALARADNSHISISGSPITSTGTITIGIETGYSIPSTNQQNIWSSKQDAITDLGTIRTYASEGHTAYGWGNHAQAGYASASSVQTLESYFTNGVANSAARLSGTSSYTAWGRTYWQNGVPSTISGNLSNVGNISSDGGYISGFYGIDFAGVSGNNAHGGFLDFNYGGSTNDYTTRIIENDNGTLSIIGYNYSPTLNIGQNDYGYLQVGSYNGSYIQIGNIRLVYDYSNNALKVMHSNGGAANLYALGGISALGISSGASGQVSTNLLPSATGTYDLGSTSYKWRNLYLAGTTSGGNGLSIITTYSGYVAFNSVNRIEFGSVVKFSDCVGIGSYNSNYDLYINGDNGGNAYLVGSISASNVINRSDMRLKDFVENVNLSVDAIAEAPSFKFTFKDGDSLLRAGTSAQYWRGVLSESVFSDADGMLGLDYGVTALVSVISVARKVMTHEERIKALEDENKRLRNEIETLKAA